MQSKQHEIAQNMVQAITSDQTLNMALVAATLFAEDRHLGVSQASKRSSDAMAMRLLDGFIKNKTLNVDLVIPKKADLSNAVGTPVELPYDGRCFYNFDVAHVGANILWVVAYHKYWDGVQALLDAYPNIDLNVKPAEQLSLVELAFKDQRLEIVVKLRNKGAKLDPKISKALDEILCNAQELDKLVCKVIKEIGPIKLSPNDKTIDPLLDRVQFYLKAIFGEACLDAPELCKMFISDPTYILDNAVFSADLEVQINMLEQLCKITEATTKKIPDRNLKKIYDLAMTAFKNVVMSTLNDESKISDIKLMRKLRNVFETLDEDEYKEKISDADEQYTITECIEILARRIEGLSTQPSLKARR